MPQYTLTQSVKTLEKLFENNIDSEQKIKADVTKVASAFMVEAVVPKVLALRDLNRWKISKTGFAPWAARTVDSKSRLLSSRRWRPPTYAKQVLLASPQTPYRPTKEIEKRATVSCSLFYGWGDGIWTHDLMVPNHTRYQLRYASIQLILYIYFDFPSNDFRALF